MADHKQPPVQKAKIKQSTIINIMKKSEAKFATLLQQHLKKPQNFSEQSFDHVFKTLKKIAKKNGVNPLFIARADAIRSTYRSDLEALRFLQIFYKIEIGKRIEGSSYNLAAHLQTDEEIELAIRLLSLHLESATTEAHRASLMAQLFRLRNLDADDAHVIKHVNRAMNSALERRLGGFQSRKKTFTKTGAKLTLLAMKDVFDAHGKRFFLDRGTLLGAVREKGFIASDYDIDVGVFSDEITLAEIIRMFEGTEFILNQDFDYKVGFIGPTGIQVDFFLSIRENGYVMSKGWKSVHTWYFSDFELMEYNFLGTTFYIPENYEKHLEENYGNWRTAAIFYDLSYNEPCVVHGHNVETLVYLTNRFCRALTSGWRYYSVEAAKVLAHRFGRDHLDQFLAPKTNTLPIPIEIAAPSKTIVILSSFEALTPWHLRLIQSAASVGTRVVVGVLSKSMLLKHAPQGCKAIPADSTQMKLASALVGIDKVYLEGGVMNGEFSSIMAHTPEAIIVPDKWLPYLHKLAALTSSVKGIKPENPPVDTRIKLIPYYEHSLCLTLDTQGNIITRNDVDAPTPTI